MTEGVYTVIEGRRGGFHILVDSCTVSLFQEDCEPSSCRMGIIFVVLSSLFLTTYTSKTLNYTT